MFLGYVFGRHEKCKQKLPILGTSFKRKGNFKDISKGMKYYRFLSMTGRRTPTFLKYLII
jgi:hypothetical protein